MTDTPYFISHGSVSSSSQKKVKFNDVCKRFRRRRENDVDRMGISRRKQTYQCGLSTVCGFRIIELQLQLDKMGVRVPCPSHLHLQLATEAVNKERRGVSMAKKKNPATLVLGRASLTPPFFHGFLISQDKIN
jgi:hypothetical protein